MTDLLSYVSIGLLLILMISSALIFHKFRFWKLIIFILTLGIYYVVHYQYGWFQAYVIQADAITYLSYYLYGMVVLFSITFKNKIKITQNLTDYDFFELEKELDEIKSTSELLRLRFISTIGLLNEALIFYDETLNGLFVTDQFENIIKDQTHQFSMEEFTQLIHEDDQVQYLSTIKKANKKNPTYDIKYRIKRLDTYVWVEEKGRMFEFDKKQHLISTIKGIDIKLFPETSIHELDSLPSEQLMFQYLTQITKENEPFYLIMIQLTNIPDINQRFGREVGNLMISEYIKKMRYHFAKDVNSIFRITGIQFGLIIREPRKYEVLDRALKSGGDLVNLSLNIGGIQQIIYPNLGIVKHEPWSNYSMNELINLSNKALTEAIRNTKKNYSVFGE